MKSSIRLIAALTFISCTLFAEPEITGTQAELRDILMPNPGQVEISTFAERTVASDQAIVKLYVYTSNRLLQSALENNNKIRT